VRPAIVAAGPELRVSIRRADDARNRNVRMTVFQVQEGGILKFGDGFVLGRIRYFQDMCLS
jgi:hypothetical protein